MFGAGGRVSAGSGHRFALPQKDFTISANTANLNLTTLLGGDLTAAEITVTINAAVYVYATSTGTPAFQITAQHADSTVTIINNGNIVGMGGNAGTGTIGVCATSAENGNPGSAGGEAIDFLNDATVTNNGVIGGGGGGGGGGGCTAIYNGTQHLYGGGGGGGGMRYTAGGGAAGGVVSGCQVNVNGLSGTNGTTTSGGNGADSTIAESAAAGGTAGVAGTNGAAVTSTQTTPGGGGGGWGSAGGTAGTGAGNVAQGSPGAGGAGGAAIAKNGNTVTVGGTGNEYGTVA